MKMKFEFLKLMNARGLLTVLSLFGALMFFSANAQTTAQSSAQSRPTYHPSLVIKAYNYTDRAIADMDVFDAYNSKPIGIVSMESGGAFGPVCCAAFKGEKLTFKWQRRGLPDEPDRWAPRPRTATATIPPYDSKTAKVMLIHVYPDEHVEIEIADKNNFMGGDIRLPITDVIRQLWFKNKDSYTSFGQDDDERLFVLHTKVAELIGNAWKKYRMTNYEDLLLYCFWKLMRLNFEIHPKVEKLLKDSQKNPGKFADFMLHLPKGFGEELDEIEKNQKIRL